MVLTPVLCNLATPRSSARISIVLNPWFWWVEMIVTVVVRAKRDHGFESPVLHE